MTQGRLQAAEIGSERCVALFRRQELRDLAEKGHERPSAILRQLACDKVERLHAIRALVDHGDACVAHELLHAPFGNIAMAAQHLLRLDRIGEAVIGEDALEHRRHQAEPLVGGLPRLFVRRMAGLILGERDPDQKGARPFVKRAHFEQHPAHVGMDQEHIGGLLRLDGTLERAALPALLGVGRSVLIRDLGDAETLHRDPEPGAVHHHEHRGQTSMRFSNQPGFGSVKVEHSCRIAVNPHFVLDRTAHDAVALADAAIRVGQEFRHEEERDAFHARRRAVDSGQHQMDDVIGEVVLARRDEDLLASDRVGVIGLQGPRGS